MLRIKLTSRDWNILMKSLRLLSLGSLCGVFAHAQSQSSPLPILVNPPHGMVVKEITPIEFTVMQTLDSSKAHKGDRFLLRVNRDVVTNGVMVPKGTFAEGRLTKVVRPGLRCKYGRLEWSIDHVHLSDGEELSLTTKDTEHSVGKCRFPGVLEIPGLMVMVPLLTPVFTPVAAVIVFTEGDTLDKALAVPLSPVLGVLGSWATVTDWFQSLPTGVGLVSEGENVSATVVMRDIKMNLVYASSGKVDPKN